jgi:nucleoside-diphosphate-sugar epimerase
MVQRIFVTGASGFVGQEFLRRCRGSGGGQITVLTRQLLPDDPSRLGSVTQVVGDLLDPDAYRSALAGCEVVVHLAATTGRASAAEHARVNVEGTRVLLEACKAAGVSRILYISTVAAGFADQSYYPYAQTKARAEDLVRDSGLQYTILRPTIVLGAKSPIWATMTKIAGLPLVPLFEGARPVEVQPVHVDDVARGIELVLQDGRFDGDVLTLGGPEALSFRRFLELVQRAVSGRQGRIVRLPLKPIRALLAVMEPVLGPVMPVTAGQLAVFANDSVAPSNWLLDRLRPGMASIEQTVEALAGDHGGRGGKTVQPASTAPAVSTGNGASLRAECRTLTRYLIGDDPNAYVEERYLAAAATHGLASDAGLSCFDRTSLKLARGGRLFAPWADAYCAFFHRSGALRRKLVVLAAILEHVAPSSEHFDRVKPRGLVATGLALAGFGLTSAFSLLMGALLLAPADLLCRLRSRPAAAVAGTEQHP